MRNIFLFIAFVFFFFLSSASAQYDWKQKGVKTLVGKERGYYGTETRPEELKKLACGCEPHADYQNQGLKLLGNLSPDMGESGKGIFWNFDKQGRAHLTELEGKDQIFLKGNCVYAYACGNLLKQEELFEKSSLPEKRVERKPQPEPEPEAEQEEEYVPAPKKEVRDRRVIGIMPETEFMTYICFWQKYEAPSMLRYVTQQEAQVAISSSGRCSGWRVCTDADLAHFGVHKPSYQNEIVRESKRSRRGY